MTDDDPARPSLERAYREAEDLLDDEPTRAARRARVLAAVRSRAAEPPAVGPRVVRQTPWRWAAAASVMVTSTLVGLAVWQEQEGRTPAPDQAAETAIEPSPLDKAAARDEPRATGRAQPPLAPRVSLEPATPVAPTTSPEGGDRRSTDASSRVAKSHPSRAPAGEAFRSRDQVTPAGAAPERLAESLARRHQSAELAASGDARGSWPGDSPRAQAAAADPHQPARRAGRAVAASSPTSAAASLAGERFFRAASMGRVDELMALLDAGMDIDRRDTGPAGETALAKSVRGGHRAAVQALLARGADPDRADHHGVSPRELAKASNDERLEQLFGAQR